MSRSSSWRRLLPALLPLLLAVLLPVRTASIAPRFSWDTVGSMSFFHACNESGLWSEEALDVIQKYQMVTVEKGQGFTDTSGNGTQAEARIIAQLAAVKARDAGIQTVFYMNSVLNWFFYAMAATYEAEPAQWMYDSATRQVRAPALAASPRARPPIRRRRRRRRRALAHLRHTPAAHAD